MFLLPQIIHCTVDTNSRYDYTMFYYISQLLCSISCVSQILLLIDFVIICMYYFNSFTDGNNN